MIKTGHEEGLLTESAKSQLHVTDSNFTLYKNYEVGICVYKYILSKFTLYYSDIIIIRNETAILLV